MATTTATRRLAQLDAAALARDLTPEERAEFAALTAQLRREGR